MERQVSIALELLLNLLPLCSERCRRNTLGKGNVGGQGAQDILANGSPPCLLNLILNTDHTDGLVRSELVPRRRFDVPDLAIFVGMNNAEDAGNRLLRPLSVLRVTI